MEYVLYKNGLSALNKYNLPSTMNTANITGEDAIHQTLRNIIKQEGCDDDSEIQFGTATVAGDGYLGVTSSIKIIGKNKSLKLFVKAAPKNDKLRNQLAVEEMYLKEIRFYESVYPVFEQFQKKRNLQNPFKNVAKCYGTISQKMNETLILEDLKEAGFVLFNRKTQMNDEHITFVLKTYARFHAVSYAMKDQDLKLFEKLCGNTGDSFFEVVLSSGYDRTLMHYCEEAKKIFHQEKDSHILTKMEKFTGTLLHFLMNGKDYIDQYSAILHGDCWCNNMMFKYKDFRKQESPIDIKLLDWQIPRINSPVFDLSYFFYSVASRDAMKNLDFYLSVYHSTLSENIKQMGSDPDKLYPYFVFMDHWKQFSKFGLALSMSIIRIMLTENDEVPDLTVTAELERGLGDGFIYNIKDENLYNQRIRDVIEHFSENKFI